MASPVINDTSSAVSPVNKLSLPFLASLEKEPHENYAYSPVSLATALGLLREGADGTTLSEVNQFFDNKDLADTLEKIQAKSANSVESKLRSANLVLHRDDIALKDTYKASIANKYKAALETFEPGKVGEAVERINKFVAENTLNMIPQLFSSLDPDSLVVLVNAVSLDAKWMVPFPMFKTRKEIFHGSNEDKSVDFMSDDKLLKHHHCSGKKLQLIELSYKDGISMLIIIPDEVQGLDTILANLTDQDIEDRIGKLENKYIDLKLPKFEVKSSYDLIPSLTKMGIGEVFTSNANLSNMLSKPARIGKAVHKTVVKVDEDGTKAAAATGFVAMPTSAMYGLVPLRVDRPFLFIIRQQSTKTNLFVGIIRNI